MPFERKAIWTFKEIWHASMGWEERKGNDEKEKRLENFSKNLCERWIQLQEKEDGSNVELLSTDTILVCKRTFPISLLQLSWLHKYKFKRIWMIWNLDGKRNVTRGLFSLVKLVNIKSLQPISHVSCVLTVHKCYFILNISREMHSQRSFPWSSVRLLLFLVSLSLR